MSATLCANRAGTVAKTPDHTGRSVPGRREVRALGPLRIGHVPMLVRRVPPAYTTFDEPSRTGLANWSGAGTPSAGFGGAQPAGRKVGYSACRVAQTRADSQAPTGLALDDDELFSSSHPRSS